MDLRPEARPGPDSLQERGQKAKRTLGYLAGG